MDKVQHEIESLDKAKQEQNRREERGKQGEWERVERVGETTREELDLVGDSNSDCEKR